MNTDNTNENTTPVHFPQPPTIPQEEDAHSQSLRLRVGSERYISFSVQELGDVLNALLTKTSVRVIRLLGSGATGIVFLVEFTPVQPTNGHKPGFLAAMKVSKPELLAPEALLLGENSAPSNKNKNVFLPRFYYQSKDFYIQGVALMMMVTEAGDTTLANWATDETHNNATRCVVDVLVGLAVEAFNKKGYHCDVKPENIVLVLQADKSVKKVFLIDVGGAQCPEFSVTSTPIYQHLTPNVTTPEVEAGTHFLGCDTYGASNGDLFSYFMTLLRTHRVRHPFMESSLFKETPSASSISRMKFGERTLSTQEQCRVNQVAYLLRFATKENLLAWPAFFNVKTLKAIGDLSWADVIDLASIQSLKIEDPEYLWETEVEDKLPQQLHAIVRNQLLPTPQSNFAPTIFLNTPSTSMAGPWGLSPLYSIEDAIVALLQSLGQMDGGVPLGKVLQTWFPDHSGILQRLPAVKSKLLEEDKAFVPEKIKVTFSPHTSPQGTPKNTPPQSPCGEPKRYLMASSLETIANTNANSGQGQRVVTFRRTPKVRTAFGSTSPRGLAFVRQPSSPRVVVTPSRSKVATPERQTSVAFGSSIPRPRPTATPADGGVSVASGGCLTESQLRQFCVPASELCPACICLAIPLMSEEDTPKLTGQNCESKCKERITELNARLLGALQRRRDVAALRKAATKSDRVYKIKVQSLARGTPTLIFIH